MGPLSAWLSTPPWWGAFRGGRLLAATLPLSLTAGHRIPHLVVATPHLNGTHRSFGLERLTLIAAIQEVQFCLSFLFASSPIFASTLVFIFRILFFTLVLTFLIFGFEVVLTFLICGFEVVLILVLLVYILAIRKVVSTWF